MMCVIPKVFLNESLIQYTMKLTQAKLLEIIRKKNAGWTSYQCRKIANISVRRVNQLYSEYLKTNKIPKIGKIIGRPTRPITSNEIRIVKQVYETYYCCASTLEKLIERDYGLKIPHNHIQKIMHKFGIQKK